MDELNNILQQQSEQLVFTPSPRVWAAVEQDIVQRERKRRWLIWFFILVGLVIAGVSIYEVYSKEGVSVDQLKKSEPVVVERSPLIKTQQQQTEALKTTVIEPAGDPTPEKQTNILRKASSLAIIENTKISEQDKNASSIIEKQGTDIIDVPNAAHTTTTLPVLHNVANRHLSKSATSAIRPHQQVAVSTQPVHTIEKEEIQPINSADRKMLQSASSLAFKPAGDAKVTVQSITVKEESKPTEISSGVSKQFPKTKTHKQNVLPQEKLVLQASTMTVEPTNTVRNENRPVAVEKNLPHKTTPNESTKLIVEKTQESIDTPLIAARDKAKSKWSVSLNIAPNSSFSRITEPKDTAIVANSRNASGRNRIGIDYNIKAGFKITRFLEVYAGIGIHNMSEQMAKLQVLPNRNPIVPNGNVGTSSPSYTKRSGLGDDTIGFVTNRFTYFEVPLGLRLRVLQLNKFSAGLDAGITINRLMRAGGYSYDTIENAYLPMDKNNVRPWMFGYGAGLSLQYNILKQVSVELMPYYRRYSGDVYKNSYLGQYFQQAGVNFSVRYQFMNHSKH